MGTDRLLRSVPDFRSSASRDLALTNDFRTVCSLPLTTHHSQPLLSSHIGSRSEEPSLVLRPGAWTRPSKEREEERKRESKRKERAKMGTDRLLWSVPDFRITNNQQRTTNNLSYHPTLVLAQKSRPSSVVPEHGPVLRKGEKRRERESKRKERAKMGTDRFLWSVPDFRKRPVLRKGEKRRERERVREKRERKWGLTGS